MDQIERWWTNLYTNNPQMALVLMGAFAGALATALFSRLLPTVISTAANIISFLGAKIGGKFGFKYIQNIYLNWVVVANQDLNLTGVVGSVEKPKLDQVFISLSVTKGPKDGIKEEREEDRVDSSKLSTRYPNKLISGRYIKNVFNGLSMYIRGVLDKVFPVPNIKSSAIFQPSRIWRLRQYIDRDMHSFLVLILLEIFPIYGFLILPNISNFSAMISVFFWVLVDFIVLRDFEETNWRRFFFICYFTPHFNCLCCHYKGSNWATKSANHSDFRCYGTCYHFSIPAVGSCR